MIPSVQSADAQAAALAKTMFAKGAAAGDLPPSPEGGLQTDGAPLSAEAGGADAEAAALVARKSERRPARAVAMGKAEAPPEEPDEESDEESDEAAESDDDGDEDGEGESDGDGDEEPMAKKARKSRMPAASLAKALDALEHAASGQTLTPSRREVLAAGLASGTLSKSERAELLDLVVGEEQQEEPMDKSFAESFAQDTVLAPDYEVSSFLERHGQLVAGGLDILGEKIAKSADQQRAFNATLAKSLRALGDVAAEQEQLIKAQTAQITTLTERLSAVENTPMPRRSVSGATALHKSFDGGNGHGGELSKSRALAGLERLMIKSRSGGKLGQTPAGHSIAHAVALVESGAELPSALADEILSA